MAEELSRRAPVQSEDDGHGRIMPAGTVEWQEHCEAWFAYHRRYRNDQSAEKIAERGGFGYLELVMFLGGPPKTWRPRR